MTEDAIPERVREYVAAFNACVESGDWTGFVTRLTQDARMSLVGVPAGPFTGRDAIAAAYSTSPPTDTLVVQQVDNAGAVDTVEFRWAHGGPGMLRLHWQGPLVDDVTVTFAS